MEICFRKLLGKLVWLVNWEWMKLLDLVFRLTCALSLKRPGWQFCTLSRLVRSQSCPKIGALQGSRKWDGRTIFGWSRSAWFWQKAELFPLCFRYFRRGSDPVWTGGYMGTQIMTGEVLHPQKIEFGVCFLFTPPKASLTCVWATRSYCNGDICVAFLCWKPQCAQFPSRCS